MSYDWNGTWPDGSAIVPAPGMLVALTDGRWHVLRAKNVTEDGGTDYCIEHCAPLAPPPTPGGLWAALEPLATGHIIIVEDQHREGLYISHGRCGGTVLLSDGTLHLETQPDRLHADQLPLLDTALQHHRAIEAYCAQPGWAV